MQALLRKRHVVIKEKRPLPDSNRGWRICNPFKTFGYPSDTPQIAFFPGFSSHRISRFFQTGNAEGDSSGDTLEQPAPSPRAHGLPSSRKVMVTAPAKDGNAAADILPPAFDGGR